MLSARSMISTQISGLKEVALGQQTLLLTRDRHGVRVGKGQLKQLLEKGKQKFFPK